MRLFPLSSQTAIHEPVHLLNLSPKTTPSAKAQSTEDTFQPQKTSSYGMPEDFPHLAASRILLNWGLSVLETMRGEAPDQTAARLHIRAKRHKERGEYALAELLMKDSIIRAQDAYGVDHPKLGIFYHQLGSIYHHQGKFAEAERYYQKDLTLIQKHMGENHPEAAACLHSLARLCMEQGHYRQAKPLLTQAAQIHEESLGLEHPQTANSFTQLRHLYKKEGKLAETETLSNKALQIQRKEHGS
jgi:tetratricopeptide (TPR) repeat protein